MSDPSGRTDRVRALEPHGVTDRPRGEATSTAVDTSRDRSRAAQTERFAPLPRPAEKVLGNFRHAAQTRRRGRSTNNFLTDVWNRETAC